ALVVGRLPDIPGPVAWGGLVLPMLWTGTGYGLMGVVNPVLQDRVSWPWFIVSQFVFGVTAPLLVLPSPATPIPPPAPPPPPPPSGRGPGRGGRLRGGGGWVVRHPHTGGWRLRPLLAALLAGCGLPGQPNPADRPVPADKVLDFATLYKTNCAGCHGADGKL